MIIIHLFCFVLLGMIAWDCIRNVRVQLLLRQWLRIAPTTGPAKSEVPSNEPSGFFDFYFGDCSNEHGPHVHVQHDCLILNEKYQQDVEWYVENITKILNYYWNEFARKPTFEPDKSIRFICGNETVIECFYDYIHLKPDLKVNDKDGNFFQLMQMEYAAKRFDRTFRKSGDNVWN